MEERKKEVLAGEEAILRLGKEAERMSAANRSLEGAAASVRKAQGEVAEAREAIKRYAESSSLTSKKVEDLVASLSSRFEALETRLRGIDLEITAFRKNADGLEESVKKTAADVADIKNNQQKLRQGLRTLYILLIVVLGVSVIGIIVNLV